MDEMKKIQKEINNYEFNTKEILQDLLDKFSKEKNISIKNKIN